MDKNFFFAGQPVSQDIVALESGAASQEEEEASASHVKSVIDDAITLLTPDASVVLGAWGLIDADVQSVHCFMLN